ncbi:MAG: DnaJ domain-containing protein [Betaproteobacteria bacterium]|nr:DnaJ domain-containing protein [Betaproteobacteria bacterium]
MDFKDYYATLGVAKDATADDVKKSFRKLARKYHPDVSKEPDADARMKEINEAYTVLSDPEKRAAYDQLGRAYQPGQDFRPPPDWDAGFEFSGRRGPGAGAGDYGDYSDFFAELFGRMGARGARARGEPFEAEGLHARGEDHHAKILVDLEDVYRGASRQISLRVPKVDAEGRLLLQTRTLNVQIPKGLREGQLMRLAGQGGPGLGEGKPGDLMLEVHFKPHPRFQAQGADVTMTLPVAPWEAALGAVVALRLPDGANLNVRIPPGAQSGRQLRVRGKGIPANPAGDLVLDVRVVVPPADTPRAKELYEAMARDLEFDPRAGMEN